MHKLRWCRFVSSPLSNEKIPVVVDFPLILYYPVSLRWFSSRPSIFCIKKFRVRVSIPDQPLRGIFCWDLDQRNSVPNKTSWVLGLQKTRISGIRGIKIDANVCSIWGIARSAWSLGCFHIMTLDFQVFHFKDMFWFWDTDIWRVLFSK